MIKKSLWMILMFMLVIAVTGCGNKSVDAGSNHTPITLTVLQYGSGISDQEFQSLLADPVKAKYPYITMQLRRLQKGEMLEKVLMEGDFPDLVFCGILDISDFKELSLTTDLNPLIQKYNLDLKYFIPATVDMVKKYGSQGEMYAMPFSLGFPILFYNKDIFDKFGVPYPTDGMTWDEEINLTKKMSRMDGDTQYQGFAVASISRLTLSMLQPKVNLQTSKAELTTDEWKRVTDVLRQLETNSGKDISNGWKAFATDRTVAMYAGYNGDISQLEDLQHAGNGFNWDMVTLPTFPDQKGVVDTPLQVLMLSSTSKHKDEAFQAIQLLTDEESQVRLSKAARPPVLTDAEVKKAFGENLASLKGKNAQAGFGYNNQPINIKTKYDDVVNKEINNAVQDINKGIDINTALRQAEDRANKQIDAMKSQ